MGCAIKFVVSKMAGTNSSKMANNCFGIKIIQLKILAVYKKFTKETFSLCNLVSSCLCEKRLFKRKRKMHLTTSHKESKVHKKRSLSNFVSSCLCAKKTFPKEKKNASHHKATKNRRFTKKDLCATLCLPVFVRKKLFQRKRKMHLTTKPQRIEGSQKKIFVQLCVFRSLCEKGFSEGKEKKYIFTLTHQNKNPQYLFVY
jgi:hypothetical protein